MHTQLAQELRPTGTVRITQVGPKNPYGIYEATVEILDPNGAWAAKLSNSGKSTMFPDDWSWDRILEEVEHAVKNNKGLVERLDNKNEFWGLSKDGNIKIHFYYDARGIISYFPEI